MRKEGNAVQIVPAEQGGPKAEITDAIRERLELNKEDMVCVTAREEKFLLKKMAFVELPAVMPGFYVFDSFTDTTVTRAYQTAPDLAALAGDRLQHLLHLAGKLRYDPVAPFRNMPGMLGCLARKEFAGGWTAGDREWIKSYVSELATQQAEDGSWQNAVPATAFHVARLLDLGCTPEEPCIRKATDWLLAHIQGHLHGYIRQ